jgi:hypothetical protein
MAKIKLTASQRKNLKKKERKQAQRNKPQVKKEPNVAAATTRNNAADEKRNVKAERDDELDDVEVVYVAEEVPADAGEFAAIFERFAELGQEPTVEVAAPVKVKGEDGDDDDDEHDDDDDDDANNDNANDDDGQPKPSRKERKRLKLQQVGLLKQIAQRPDIVEVRLLPRQPRARAICSLAILATARLARHRTLLFMLEFSTNHYCATYLPVN